MDIKSSEGEAKMQILFPCSMPECRASFQLPTLMALIQSLHLHLIQDSFNCQATEDMESQLRQESSHWQQLHEALKHNWKAASWHLPCDFLEKPPFHLLHHRETLLSIS